MFLGRFTGFLRYTVAGSFAATGAVATGVGSAVIVLAAAGLLLRARFARTTIEEPAA